ncbi:hypothetical protein C1X35_31600 [Pseudomonas sp. FW306-1C-G01A]|nr:hypothetical protein [Pseudomonas sp.]MSU92925.1 hypothetical protein [Pseudomonas mandelii]PMV80034.1 hypothetical protein C1X56_31475 [Pseudomonas sp. GW101-1A09]PMV89358.1 hypothetical protein C1X51_25395 [Pseudomonas sp. FW306-2-2C-B10A]PMW01293.1 hypothetical protein C1X55_07280 [Pseudomonas sp. GW460-C8]PMW06614.1 hypothetical protein C1X50_08580 [Pseudomonas sp. MPR-TSA4]PMW07803.1 hypothetical protein C1X52_29885 [Pseudomonas sp. FW306-2-1A-C05A]PMW21592.1 hypothetical protein C1X
MADRRFFHDSGVETVDDLIRVAYDLAWYWKVDPQQMMARSLDMLIECLEHGQRIHGIQEGQ